MTTDVVARAEALLAGILTNDGAPWFAEHGHVWADTVVWKGEVRGAVKVCDCAYHSTRGGFDTQRTTAAFIAASPQLANDLLAEVRRLRAALEAIGNLPDVDADNRSWMVRNALAGKPASDS